MQLVLMFRIPPPMDNRSNLLFLIRVPYLLEKGEETPGPISLKEMGGDFLPRQKNNEGPRERGGISYLRRQIMKVPGSQGLIMEEFLNLFFFQIGKEIFLCTPSGD